MLNIPESKFEYIQIPTEYTFQNKLLTQAIQEILRPFIGLKVFNDEETKKAEQQLQASLMSTFKFAFTKIQLTCEDRKLTGFIEYNGGTPLKFELSSTTNLID
jgi:hypothetical protein